METLLTRYKGRLSLTFLWQTVYGSSYLQDLHSSFLQCSPCRDVYPLVNVQVPQGVVDGDR